MSRYHRSNLFVYTTPILPFSLPAATFRLSLVIRTFPSQASRIIVASSHTPRLQTKGACWRGQKPRYANTKCRIHEGTTTNMIWGRMDYCFFRSTIKHSCCLTLWSAGRKVSTCSEIADLLSFSMVFGERIEVVRFVASVSSTLMTSGDCSYNRPSCRCLRAPLPVFTTQIFSKGWLLRLIASLVLYAIFFPLLWYCAQTSGFCRGKEAASLKMRLASARMFNPGSSIVLILRVRMCIRRGAENLPKDVACQIVCPYSRRSARRPDET